MSRKTVFMRNGHRLICTVMAVIIFSNCTSEKKDVSVKKDLAAKVKAEIDFVGVRFTINEGIVTLNGVCATRSALDAVHHKVKNLYGVKDVINNIAISNVIIGTDWMLKRGVDSVLTEYPQVEAITKDSIVTLLGKVDAAKREELLLKIKGLMPRQIEAHLADKVAAQGK